MEYCLAQPMMCLIGLLTCEFVSFFAGYVLLADRLQNRVHSMGVLNLEGEGTQDGVGYF